MNQFEKQIRRVYLRTTRDSLQQEQKSHASLQFVTLLQCRLPNYHRPSDNTNPA